MSCPDIAQCFNTETKKMVDYAWRPVADGKLLGFLGSVACKKRGWFPYENGQHWSLIEPKLSEVLSLFTR